MLCLLSSPPSARSGSPTRSARAFQPAGRFFDARYLFLGPLLHQCPRDGARAQATGSRPLAYVSLGTLFNRDHALPLPPHARAKIERLLARLELVLAHITESERERDAVAETAAPDHAARMIQQLAGLRGIGVQSATVLVREAFVRRFANGKAPGAYAGLTAAPYSSGGLEREQGIGKAGNRRLRSVMVELAWLWQRYQPGAAQVVWFRERVGKTGRRLRKVMVVALARKLLIALWRYVTDGVVPEGAAMKPAT